MLHVLKNYYIIVLSRHLYMDAYVFEGYVFLKMVHGLDIMQKNCIDTSIFRYEDDWYAYFVLEQKNKNQN